MLKKVILVLLISLPASARINRTEGRLMVLGFDMLFNGLKSGIGAHSKGLDFWPAFGKGVMAGAVVYSGKEIASFNRYPFVGAAGKLVHDFGVSVSDNVMRGDPIFSKYRTEISFIELDINKKGLDLYFLPLNCIGLVFNIARGYQFDGKRSLYNLTPVFSFGGFIHVPATGLDWPDGFAQFNVMTYQRANKYIDRYQDDVDTTISHEFNHVLFQSEFRFVDDLIGKKSEVFAQLPIFNKFAIAFDYIHIGSIMTVLLASYGYIGKPFYWYSLPEIEAHTMQRPNGSKHPFYR